MTLSIEHIEMLLLIVSLGAMATSFLRIPYSVGLVFMGAALSVFPLIAAIPMTTELIYKVFLPPLIFEAALFLPHKALRQELALILSLASLGVVIQALVIVLAMHYILAWPWLTASIFGAILSATDPISVIAIFKECHVQPRLKLIVEGESLFNDGTAAVLFALLVSVASGAQYSIGGMVLTLLITVMGSLIVGAMVAGAILFIGSKTDDHLVELTLTTVAAYGTFVLAEHFHLSGILATLTAGLVLNSKKARQIISDKGRIAINGFWEYLAFVANSLIFLLIGIREYQQPFQQYVYAAAIAIGFMLLGRAICVYGISATFSRTTLHVSSRYQHIIVWGGLRGALALALALGLPVTLPYHDEVIALVFIVVGFSIVVQGLTVKPLLRYLGELKAP